MLKYHILVLMIVGFATKGICDVSPQGGQTAKPAKDTTMEASKIISNVLCDVDAFLVAVKKEQKIKVQELAKQMAGRWEQWYIIISKTIKDSVVSEHFDRSITYLKAGEIDKVMPILQ